MVRKKLIIHNPTGLHLRPAGLFCKTAMQFQSKITFLSKNTTANAKSVLSVLGAVSYTHLDVYKRQERVNS